MTALPFVIVAAWMATRTDGVWTPTRYTGLALILLGLGFLTAARVQLEAALSGPTPLVTTGIYSRLRHPIYFFSFVTFAGLLLYLDKTWGVPFLLLLTLVRFRWAAAEERGLEALYGERYRRYKRKTWF